MHKCPIFEGFLHLWCEVGTFNMQKLIMFAILAANIFTTYSIILCCNHLVWCSLILYNSSINSAFCTVCVCITKR